MLKGDPTDYNLAELARMIVRYKGFPGARDIQKDLQTVLNQWNYTEETLYAKTREIHQQGQIYTNLNRNREDWS